MVSEGPQSILEGFRIYPYLKKENETKEPERDKRRCKRNAPLSDSDQRVTKWAGPCGEAVAVCTHSLGVDGSPEHMGGIAAVD